MNIDPVTIISLLVAVSIGCYTQAVTGFAFGLIFVGVTSLGQFVDLTSATLIASILAVFNTIIALKKEQRHTDWRLVGATTAFSLPMIAIGYWLLGLLSTNYVSTLRLILGCVIIAASLVLLFPPKPGKSVSSLPVFAFFGALAGILGGLFATSGPPLVFQFYRQNLPIAVIRDSLLAIFAISALSRTVLAITTDGLPEIIWITVLFALPVTFAATWAGKHYPPQLSDTNMRRVAAALLVATGLSLVVS